MQIRLSDQPLINTFVHAEWLGEVFRTGEAAQRQANPSLTISCTFTDMCM